MFIISFITIIILIKFLQSKFNQWLTLIHSRANQH